eukprot:COSAG06_NODE_19330_length_843_cov_1.552419_1_plen_151_part_01
MKMKMGCNRSYPDVSAHDEILESIPPPADPARSPRAMIAFIGLNKTKTKQTHQKSVAHDCFSVCLCVCPEPVSANDHFDMHTEVEAIKRRFAPAVAQWIVLLRKRTARVLSSCFHARQAQYTETTSGRTQAENLLKQKKATQSSFSCSFPS